MNKKTISNNKIQTFQIVAVIFVGFAAVFLAPYSSLGFYPKLVITLIAFLLAVVFVLFIISVGHRNSRESEQEGESGINQELGEELATLEEAAVFFSASMAPDEMLRLVAARLEGVLEGTEVEFFIESGAARLQPVVNRLGRRTGPPDLFVAQLAELASKSLATGSIERSDSMLRAEDTTEMHVVALPLSRGTEIISIFTASAESADVLPDDDLLRAIADRVEPLVAGSISFASSAVNALTDSLTSLPNERAMYLVLENQVAEAERFGLERKLTVLAVDIQSFDEINQRWGHSEGDRLLSYVAETIQEQLRKMDFIARTSNDEFIVILPTASGKSSDSVKERIESVLENNPFETSEGTKQKIVLSFGSATFGDDGVTSSTLIGAAIERKQLDKSRAAGSVIMFPKEPKD